MPCLPRSVVYGVEVPHEFTSSIRYHHGSPHHWCSWCGQPMVPDATFGDFVVTLTLPVHT